MSISVDRTSLSRRLPGDLAMWFFILAELTVFAILILAFAVTQVLHPELFRESRAALDSSIGLALTLSLLTSGLLAALAVEQVRLGLEHNTFFTLYWILTGFHFLHVLLGLVILGWMAERCRRRAYSAQDYAGLESGVLYWHMVDMVWVLLFPLVYVIN